MKIDGGGRFVLAVADIDEGCNFYSCMPRVCPSFRRTKNDGLDAFPKRYTR